jgi:hypothetical protein
MSQHSDSRQVVHSCSHCGMSSCTGDPLVNRLQVRGSNTHHFFSITITAHSRGGSLVWDATAAGAHELTSSTQPDQFRSEGFSTQLRHFASPAAAPDLVGNYCSSTQRPGCLILADATIVHAESVITQWRGPRTLPPQLLQLPLPRMPQAARQPQVSMLQGMRHSNSVC